MNWFGDIFSAKNKLLLVECVGVSVSVLFWSSKIIFLKNFVIVFEKIGAKSENEWVILILHLKLHKNQWCKYRIYRFFGRNIISVRMIASSSLMWSVSLIQFWYTEHQKYSILSFKKRFFIGFCVGKLLHWYAMFRSCFVWFSI